MYGNRKNDEKNSCGLIFDWFSSSNARLPDFGCSVSISGDYAVSGAQCDDDNGNWSGSAYIFHKTGPDAWDSGEKLLAFDAAADDAGSDPGGALSAADGYCIIGARRDYELGYKTGSIYIMPYQ